MHNPSSISDNALLAQAQNRQSEGDHLAAVVIFRDLVTRHPSNPRLLHLAGSAEIQAGNNQQAIDLLQKSLDLDPKQADTLSHLGVAFWNRRDYKHALVAYKTAIHLNPSYAEPYNNLCMVLLEGFNEAQKALVAVNKAIELNPEYADAYSNRGNVLQALNRLEEALDSYDHAIAVKPNSASAHNNRGNALRKLGRPDQALSAYQTAILNKPDYSEAYCNMGCALVDLGLIEDASLFYQRALALEPSSSKPYFNLGSLEGVRGNHALAQSFYEKAISLNPAFAEAYWNKSLLLLLQGDYAQGFHLYEWGWKCKLRGGDRGLKAPRWLGQLPLEGKRLLIHQEQGIGDCIQYARYIEMLVEMGATVILETVAPLIPLLKSLRIPCEFVVVGQPLPAFDYFIPLMSLPLAFGTTLENMPPSAPYLFEDALLVDKWTKKLGPRTKPRVGLVWSGSTLHKNDQNRSMPLKEVLPLLSLPLEFHCLQKEIREEDQVCLPALPSVHIHNKSLNDFADTAALVSLMDVVISVDTSVAHVGGALGKPVWLLLAAAPDWRWSLKRDDSPWYPSARLFRQEKLGKWDSVIQKVREGLSNTFIDKEGAA